MTIFKNKILLIIFIIGIGLVIMRGYGIITKKGMGTLSMFNKKAVEGVLKKAVEWGRSIITKEETGIPPTETTPETKAAEETLEEIIPARVTKVTKMNYKDTITSFGTIKGFGEIPIRFKESGTVSKFYFKEGDEIKKGDIAVSQDHEQEKLKLEYAKIEYDKNKALYDLGAITQDKLRQTELGIESAELELKKRDFYAPCNGFMGTRKVNEGELVSPNDVVATFLDISSVYCEVGIIERDIEKVKIGQKATATFDAFPNEVFEGIVDSVSPMVEGRSRTQTVKILMPNEKHLIKPGMFARTEITTFEKKDALVVPRQSIKETEEGYFVFGVMRDEQKKEKTVAGFEIAVAKVIPIKVERATEESALIKKGLIEGQEIVLESPEAKGSIKDGGKIEIISSE
jgi:membrane fusion protein (multidrug efflux system)